MLRMVAAVMALVVLVVLMVLSLRQDAHGQALMGVGSACTQTTAGNILVSPFLLNDPPLAVGQTGSSIPRSGPKKVVLAEDLPVATLVCRETETGSVCRTIAQLFK